MEEAVAAYTARAAEKLRRQHLAAGRLTVFVMTNRFRQQDAQYSREQGVQLPVATADSGKLIAAALRGLAALWREGFRYKKAGVMLLDLTPAAAVQGGLFDAPDDTRAKARMLAVDKLNGRYGRDTVRFAATGIGRPWKLRSAFISPRYTTCWEELLTVPGGPWLQGGSQAAPHRDQLDVLHRWVDLLPGLQHPTKNETGPDIRDPVSPPHPRAEGINAREAGCPAARRRTSRMGRTNETPGFDS